MADRHIAVPFPHAHDPAPRLIAAAPDLLEALQDCIEQIAQMQPLFDDEDGAIRAALDKAQRAVDKATVGSERGQ